MNKWVAIAVVGVLAAVTAALVWSTLRDPVLAPDNQPKSPVGHDSSPSPQPDPAEAEYEAWLSREATALLAADPASLSPELQAVRQEVAEHGESALPSAATRAIMRKAIEGIGARLVDMRVPPIWPTTLPEGENGWPHYLAAQELCEGLESSHGTLFPGEQRIANSGTRAIELSNELPTLVRKALDCAHVTAPNRGIGRILDVTPMPMAVVRVAAVRIEALIAAGQSEVALGEAADIIALMRRIDLGSTSICDLVSSGVARNVLEKVLCNPAWTAEQLESLLPTDAPIGKPLSELLVGDTLLMKSVLKEFSENPKSPDFLRQAFEAPSRGQTATCSKSSTRGRMSTTWSWPCGLRWHAGTPRGGGTV